MKKIFALLLIVGLILAGSPYYKAYQLKTAYDAQDGIVVANAIDYPRLTTNVKSQLTSRFADTVQKKPLIAKLGGSKLIDTSNKFINHAVDGAISKENIKTMIRTQGQSNLETKELVAAWIIASNKVDLNSLVQDFIVHRGNMQAVVKKQLDKKIIQQSKGLAENAQSGTDTGKPTLTYCGINCFNISGHVKGYPITVHLERDGFIDWKIVGVELP